MSRSRFLLLALVCASAAAVAGTLAGRAARTARHEQPSPPHTEQPSLSVDPRHLDFGEVWETDRFEWTVPVRNTSDKIVVVERWQTSCDCSDISPATTTFQPGETKSVSLRFDLSSKVNAISLLPTTFATNFAPVIATTTPHVWRVSGRIRPVLAVGAPITHQISSETQSPPHCIKLTFAEPISQLDVGVNLKHVQSKLTSEFVGRREVDLALMFSHPFPAGQHSFTLHIRASTVSGRSFSKSIPCELFAGEELHTNPSNVIVANIRTGERRSELVQVKSRGGAQVKIVDLKLPRTDSVTLTARAMNHDEFVLTLEQLKDVKTTTTFSVEVSVSTNGTLRNVPLTVSIIP